MGALGVFAFYDDVRRLLWPDPPAAANVLIGIPVVLDGDTISIVGTVVRLNGIDAEEIGGARGAEPHGLAAKAAMQSIVGTGASVRCTLTGEKANGREVGSCTNVRGQDIAAELVRQGFALDCARYSGGRYRTLEPTGVRQKLLAKPYC